MDNSEYKKEMVKGEETEASAESTSAEDDDSSLEKIRKFFSQKFKLQEGSAYVKDADKVLKELNVEGIVDYIEKTGCKRIITMAGAGISTSAGIPDFRSPSSGLYHNLEKYNLPHPQAIFDIDFFTENPEPFFVLAKQLLPEDLKPTPSHYFIRLLWEKGLLLRHYTQNIDTLERIAGLPADKLVEAHGTFHTGRCLKCRRPYELSWIKGKIVEGLIPKCEECQQGVVKPDIVFFGEMLPDRFHRLIEHDFPKADLLIIMGSSLVVQPFASLIDRVPSTCPRLLINREKVGMQDRLSRVFGLRQGFVFDPERSELGRDVAWIGDCDTGCLLLAEKLGWGDELKTLIASAYQRPEQHTSSNVGK